jgi:hypothetical protein
LDPNVSLLEAGLIPAALMHVSAANGNNAVELHEAIAAVLDLKTPEGQSAPVTEAQEPGER